VSHCDSYSEPNPGERIVSDLDLLPQREPHNAFPDLAVRLGVTGLYLVLGLDKFSSSPGSPLGGRLYADPRRSMVPILHGCRRVHWRSVGTDPACRLLWTVRLELHDALRQSDRRFRTVSAGGSYVPWISVSRSSRHDLGSHSTQERVMSGWSAFRTFRPQVITDDRGCSELSPFGVRFKSRARAITLLAEGYRLCPGLRVRDVTPWHGGVPLCPSRATFTLAADPQGLATAAPEPSRRLCPGRTPSSKSRCVSSLVVSCNRKLPWESLVSHEPGSIPIQSLTADRIRCRDPRYCSVV